MARPVPPAAVDSQVEALRGDLPQSDDHGIPLPRWLRQHSDSKYSFSGEDYVGLAQHGL